MGAPLYSLKLCRFLTPAGVAFGALKDDFLYDFTSLDPVSFKDMNSAYSASGSSIPVMLALLEDNIKKAPKMPYSESLLKIPLQPAEIWAAGVTYLRSRDARESETASKGIYDRVYNAERPELFLKDSGGLRCRGPGEEICIRSDSKWSVPEPELVVVFNESADPVGYTVGNDVSSRDIEGENPLYLPQAKVYRGSSAIGPVVTTRDEITDPSSVEIAMRISRKGAVVFEGKVNTSQMKRSIKELSYYLKRDNTLGTFTLLMTGTSLVPPDDFTLLDGDLVEIEVEGIGLLRNRVAQTR